MQRLFPNFGFFFYDSQLNELEHWNFEHLPDLLYKDSKGEIHNYNGVMNKESLENFIKKEAKKENILTEDL